MTIFGKRLSEYLAFAMPFLILIIVVGIARLVISYLGEPFSVVKWISVNAVLWIGVIYYSIRIHTTGFGSYKHLLPICVLQLLTVQLIIVPAIIVAICTGHDNVYSIPEAAFGQDGKTWTHVFFHLFFGPTLGSLFNWLVGCLIMLITKKVAPGSKHVVPVAY
jgi:hypothetical protein